METNKLQTQIFDNLQVFNLSWGEDATAQKPQEVSLQHEQQQRHQHSILISSDDDDDYSDSEE